MDTPTNSSDATSSILPSSAPDLNWQFEIIQAGSDAVSAYHAGQVELALVHAQRSSALRENHWGNDVAATARARSDEAVILTALGRFAEASTRYASAFATLQAHGAESEAIVIVLENAARCAYASGDDVAAREYLRQLGNVSPSSMAEDGPLLALLALLDEPQEDAVADVAIAETDDPYSTLGELELVEPPPPTLDRVPESRRHIHRDDDALGFLVQHGAAVTPDEPSMLLESDPDSLPELALPDVNYTAAEPVEPQEQAPVFTAFGEEQHEPAEPALVLSAAIEPREVTQPTPVRPISQRNVPVAARMEPVLKDHPRIRASGGARVWLIVGGGLAALAAAIAGYLRA